MHDVRPLASLKDYLAVATIKEAPSVELHSSDALTIVQADLSELKTEAEAIRKGADEDDLYDVVGLMEDHLEQYNKTLWFRERTPAYRGGSFLLQREQRH